MRLSVSRKWHAVHAQSRRQVSLLPCRVGEQPRLRAESHVYVPVRPDLVVPAAAVGIPSESLRPHRIPAGTFPLVATRFPARTLAHGCTMKKLQSFLLLSLDGYYADVNGDTRWARGRSDPEFDAFTKKNASGGGTLLMGRKTYDTMVSFWP